MNKRTTTVIGVLLASAGLFALALFMLASSGTSAALAAPQAPEAWLGIWQMGPNLDTTILGCPAGNGLARYTGVYYAPTNRVYFLGGRCENNTTTTGTVFYFDVPTQSYGVTGAVMPTPVSNHVIALVPDDGQGNGPGLYIFGGRTGSGAQSNAVQVYYPTGNTVATIATDPYPASPLGSPGTVQYTNGKVYVIGGFTGTAMYAQTWVYDPAAAAGSRWTNSGCDLPTARSYIAGAVIGNSIYAIGGDEYTTSLIPISDTVVLDTNNMAACWQDGLMADFPVGNGDAQAAYVNEGYLGGVSGGIFVAGGYWPSPGPYRWVYRYDVATDAWETFPNLVIPDPASGRRNHALVYLPASAGEGLGDGVPGLWAFGGYDGSGTNAMTESSEFFSISANPVLVLPHQLEALGIAGSTVNHDFTLVNQSGITDTFNLSFSSSVTWTASLPASIGPMGDGDEVDFTMGIDIPGVVPCPSTSYFTVTATSQSNPLTTDSQEVSVRVACSVGGTVYDTNTGSPLPNAYVWIQTDPGGTTGEYYDAYSDVNGDFVMSDVLNGTYYAGASAQFHQASFYPSGWPTASVMINVAGSSASQDFSLVASDMDWDAPNFQANLEGGESVTFTMVITNNGSGPLKFNTSLVDGLMPDPPTEAVPGLGRVDAKIYTDLATSPEGVADFVVVLGSQANLDAAYNIADWSTRGQYVYETLSKHAEQTQTGLRRMLDAQGANYQPLYIINAVLVYSGNRSLVDSLTARGDVSQLVANHTIALESRTTTLLERVFAFANSPEAVAWGVDRTKAPQVWSNYGVTGQGIVVANVDSGVQWDHPALKNQYRGWDGATADHDYNWYDPYHQGPGGGTIPADVSGHGTHVMGTMVGDDGAANQIGMAPGARWIACDGGDDVSGYLLTNELLICAQWIVAPWDLSGANPDPDMRPNIVNNSWGGGPEDFWYTGAVAAWRASGIFPAFSGGNSGPSCNTVHSPGDYWHTFASAASDSSNAIAGFSSRGPSNIYNTLKPQLTAPGVSIYSSVPGNAYANYSGTSMASPHTSGAVALLWSANPELIGQIDLTAWLLQYNAKPYYTTEGCGGDTNTTRPNHTWGWGLLDILAAVDAAQAGGITPPWATINPQYAIVEPGNSVALDVVFNAPMVVSANYTGTLWLVADDPYTQDLRLPLELNVASEAPTADFTSNSPVNLGETAYFTATVTGTQPFEYLWDFGDGITSTLVAPTHVYTATGTFTVTLTVTNFVDSVTIEKPFTVDPAIPPSFDIYLPLVMKGQ